MRHVVVATALCLFASAALAETYYVAPPASGGSNANPGTLEQPWATLQHAANTIGPGDTVLVRAGDYVGAEFTTSGTPAEPIVLQAFPGELVRIVADAPTRPDGINLEGASWMTVDGFQVDGRTRAGIRAVLCEHVTIRNNRLDQNGRWGILTGFCDDLVIENNVASRSVIEHGIYVSNSGDRPIVRGNTLFSNNANGLHMNGDVFSQPGDGIISNALVENNVIHDNGVAGGSGINMDGVQDSLIRNNLLYAARASGISLYRIDGGGPSTGNRVLNNTVVVGSAGRWALNIRDGSTGNTVRNNVLLNLHSFRGSMTVCNTCLAGFTSDRNVVMNRFTLDDGNTVLTLAQWQLATGQDANSILSTQAAVFVDVATADYRLSDTSPALDAGELRIDVPADIVGTARPQGATHDIGAYESLDPDVLFANGFE